MKATIELTMQEIKDAVLQHARNAGYLVEGTVELRVTQGQRDEDHVTAIIDVTKTVKPTYVHRGEDGR